ncbi:MAG TPA: hypothetical protein VNB29_05740 [Chthoniobacterales bacterium]|nr:hypothetical protein [Chthoniobacterales bacterium]
MLSLLFTWSEVSHAGSAEESAHTFQVDPYGAGRGDTFEVVPGKNSKWSFTLEPYGWLPGLVGDVGIKGFPASHIDYSPKTLLSNLQWGVFMKGEARYGRWGLLGDGMFVDLKADADPSGPLYKSASLSIQQGMAQLALAYRVWEDRRGYVDLYVGARYNYFGLNLGADLDDSGISSVGDNASQRIAEHLKTAAGDLVSSRADAISRQVTAATANLRAAAQPQLDALQRQITQAIQSGKEASIAQLEAAQNALLAKVASGVDAGTQQIDALRSQVQANLRASATDALVQRWADVPREIRRLQDKRTLDKALNPVHREFVSLVQAQVQQRVAVAKGQALQMLNEQIVAIAKQRALAAAQVLEQSLRAGSRDDRAAARRLVASANTRLANAQTKSAIDAASASAAAEAAESAARKAQKKLANKIADKLEDSLPTSGDGNVWWVDPIVGVRAQVDLTRWLFLATQCDVGGFGAGSQIAWNLNATIGVNWTRNLFTELGYRYYYVDYQRSGVTYDMAEAGLFMGLGVKF